ncbi:MAG: cytochrome c [Acidimicrobiia bacterium]|nr:cytochrome c [Acidimicrobiia bacterium]
MTTSLDDPAVDKFRSLVIRGAIGVGITLLLAFSIYFLVPGGGGYSFVGAEVSPGAIEGLVAPAGTAIDALEVATGAGCLACHSTDGTPKLGPTWLGLAGSERMLLDGTTVIADSDYLRRSIMDPGAQVAEGFSDLMIKTFAESLSAEEIDALVAYIESFGS